MASEAQKDALSKARASKKSANVASPANPGDQGHAHSITVDPGMSHSVGMHYYDLSMLHREVEAAAEDVYHGRKLFINLVLAPVANNGTVITEFGGIPVRPSVRKELVLSNGEIVGF